MGGVIQSEQILAYLLGELSSEERAAIEREVLTDDVVYEQVLAVEDDLAYEYVQGHLTPEQRANFERTIGATERGRAKLRFARSLLNVLRAGQAPVPGSRPGKWASIAAAALVIPLAVLYWRVTEFGRQIEKLRVDVAATRSTGSKSPVEAAFLLTPGISRSGGETSKLRIAAFVESIRFQLISPPDGPGECVIAIYGADHTQVWSGSSSALGKVYLVTLPAKLLASGSYEIRLKRLSAGEQEPDLASYVFVLVRD